MISSINSAMSTMTMQATQKQTPPPEKDVFQLSDTDGDGLVSGTELETLLGGIKETTNTEIDSETILNNFDVDGNSELSGEELLKMLNSYGFTPPSSAAGEGGLAPAMPPPPSVSSEEAISAYAQNSEEDMVEQVLELLQKSDVTPSIDITS